MFDFFRRRQPAETRSTSAQPPTLDSPKAPYVPDAPDADESWTAKEGRDQVQREDEPAYGGAGGAGYFGSSDSGGQSFNSAQRLYPGDPGYRAHPTRPVEPRHMHAAHANSPKDYLRTDARIRDDVCERLAMQRSVDVSEVEVDVSDGVVCLSGTVEDRYEKRVIEDMAEAVYGVVDVDNRVCVQQRDGSSDDGSVSPERTLNLS